MITHEINLLKQIKALRYGLFCLILMMVILVTIFFTDNYNSSTNRFNMLILFSIAFLPFILPLIFVHFNYYLENRNVTLQVSCDGQNILYKNGSVEISLSATNIQLIEQNLSFQNRGGMSYRRLTPWTNYSYIKIQLKNGSTIYLTSLLIDNKQFPIFISHRIFRRIPYIEKDSY